MRRRNNGTGEINTLQNEFTAYLLVALRRQKKAYDEKSGRLKSREISVDYQTEEFADERSHDGVTAGASMRCMENDDLLQALERLTARERYILFQRVLEGRSYEELSGPLGLRYSGTAAAYRRIIQKLRKELRGDKP
ncbi:MAG: sigma-70 family RNA polymerase sigma factor [Oscillospiraceae bacterium]